MNSNRVESFESTIFVRVARRLVIQTIFSLLMLFLISSCGGGHYENEGDVPLIFAAASLADVLGNAAQRYEIKTGKRVDFSFGGSIALANQIASLGAPADGVFFVGDEATEVIKRAGLIHSEGYYTMLTNSLVLIGRDAVIPVSSLNDVEFDSGQIAIGDPAVVPAGRYAQEALESKDLWDTLLDRLILSIDVRAAMAAVESGNADYGIVYRTDALTSNSVFILFEITDGDIQINYQAMPLATSANAAEADEFFDFLRVEPEIRELFTLAGFFVAVLPH